MRITDKEQKVFIAVLSEYVSAPSELRLFGSRADDNAIGGDVDLLLTVADEATRAKISFNKPEILSQIKDQIGEQKIDLLIATTESIKHSAFLKTILPEAVCLNKWERN